jgi:hypothetical protein
MMPFQWDKKEEKIIVAPNWDELEKSYKKS